MACLEVSDNTIRIVGSYNISKYEFDGIIDGIYDLHPSHPVITNRSKQSIKNEWAVHNLFYNLGIMPSRTQSVDFNYPLTKLETTTYKCLGWLSLLFIK